MHILMIEDDKDLCAIVGGELNKIGYSTEICNNGDEAMFYAMKKVYDIIILDRMLPEKDGLTILKEIRKNNVTTPVIMVTAMDSIGHRIEGLDTGADDYLVKPFAMEELFARIRALVRRPAKIVDSNIIHFSNITLNINENKLISNTSSCDLSKRETDLLAFFIRNKNQVLTRDMILTRVWGADSSVTDSNLDNFISFLRKRLKVVNSNVVLKTVRAVGYRLEENSTCYSI